MISHEWVTKIRHIKLTFTGWACNNGFSTSRDYFFRNTVLLFVSEESSTAITFNSFATIKSDRCWWIFMNLFHSFCVAYRPEPRSYCPVLLLYDPVLLLYDPESLLYEPQSEVEWELPVELPPKELKSPISFKFFSW